ncbi:50S ribosomal protein L29, chloroplastic-like [Actinidia eriantha]|uniref:50S ribosomal protein L29, chloroplastic-like n=1 Tax=Actinidia eriantha TaxID=165200 RepID=UPI0025873948|nr:50S ribosomal protein L29, chloroplastic-like [Actinidia eriantha]
MEGIFVIYRKQYRKRKKLQKSVQSANISLSSPPEQTTLEPDHSQRQRTMLGLSIAPTLTPKPTVYAIPKPVFNGVRIAHVRPTRHVSARNPRALVVTMAKREEELKEIREKPTEQINEEIVELKGELFMLRLQRSARNEFKSSEFRRMRKRIARMLTVRRERELEEGINKRMSRKLDRQWKKSIVVRPPPSLKKLQEEEAAAEAKEST